MPAAAVGIAGGDGEAADRPADGDLLGGRGVAKGRDGRVEADVRSAIEIVLAFDDALWFLVFEVRGGDRQGVECECMAMGNPCGAGIFGAGIVEAEVGVGGDGGAVFVAVSGESFVGVFGLGHYVDRKGWQGWLN